MAFVFGAIAHGGWDSDGEYTKVSEIESNLTLPCITRTPFFFLGIFGHWHRFVLSYRIPTRILSYWHNSHRRIPRARTCSGMRSS